MASNKDKVEIFDCPIDNLTMEETIQQVEEFIQSGEPHQHVVINVDKLVKMHRDPRLKRIIQSCDLISVDGKPVVWASRLIGKPIRERVSGFYLMQNLIKISAEKGHSIYFLGAQEEIVRKAVKHYQEKFPGVKIAGFHHGFWKPEEEEELVKNVRQSDADILFVAMSSPKKELFIRKHLRSLNVPFVMGVGGSFDVVAGKVKRAPLWMERTGLTWFWRFLQEPRTMWRRYFVEDLAFFSLILQELMNSKKR